MEFFWGVFVSFVNVLMTLLMNKPQELKFELLGVNSFKFQRYLPP